MRKREVKGEGDVRERMRMNVKKERIPPKSQRQIYPILNKGKFPTTRNRQSPTTGTLNRRRRFQRHRIPRLRIISLFLRRNLSRQMLFQIRSNRRARRHSLPIPIPTPRRCFPMIPRIKAPSTTQTSFTPKPRQRRDDIAIILRQTQLTLTLAPPFRQREKIRRRLKRLIM